MNLTEWKLCFVQSVDRLVRTSFAFKMRLALVLLFSVVIVLSVFCPVVQLSQTDGHHQHAVSVSPRENVALGLLANLTHLKHAIESIRKQKRNIIQNHLISDYSLQQTQPTNGESKPHADSSNESSKSVTKKLPSGNDLTDYIENGIFWSAKIESFIPKGFTSEDDADWLSSLRNSSVADVAEGCGRMQNRLLTLNSGKKVCVRYRKNSDQVQGEYVSFLLARLLHIGNVPPSALVPSVFQPPANSELRWHQVKAKLKQAMWESKPVVLTKFVADLDPAYIPNGLRTSQRQLHPVLKDIGHRSASEITELVQWSDLIVLDYLTANLDRMLNNMINERWNPQMMDSPAHNLLRQEPSNLLLFIDNESGLFHGYRLLKKFDPFHRSLLKMLCVFRKSTVEQLEKLTRLSDKEFFTMLRQHYRKHTLGASFTTTDLSATILPKANAQTLRKRMKQVLDQVDKCRSQFVR